MAVTASAAYGGPTRRRPDGRSRGRECGGATSTETTARPADIAARGRILHDDGGSSDIHLVVGRVARRAGHGRIDLAWDGDAEPIAGGELIWLVTTNKGWAHLRGIAIARSQRSSTPVPCRPLQRQRGRRPRSRSPGDPVLRGRCRPECREPHPQGPRLARGRERPTRLRLDSGPIIATWGARRCARPSSVESPNSNDRARPWPEQLAAKVSPSSARARRGSGRRASRTRSPIGHRMPGSRSSPVAA